MSSALIVVDVEVCFTEGGTLPVTGGAHVAGAISDYLAEHEAEYDVIVASRDWHNGPPDTNDGHFATPGTVPDFEHTWPVHGVAGTPDAAYHPALRLPERAVHIVKGAGRADYSAFDGVQLGPDGTPGTATLAQVLAGVEHVDVVGIATDHCVKATALDARAAGHSVAVLTDLTAGVGVRTTIAALTQLAQAGVQLTTTTTSGHCPCTAGRHTDQHGAAPLHADANGEDPA